MQVAPQTPLPAVYQIVDHTDPNRDTYFVRAVMRDSLTGGTLQALNLTSAGIGTGRYAGAMPAPEDGTGLGRQIDITITVYTDSGYSLKSELYQQTIEKWYVKVSSGSLGGGGGGGGDSVDYEYLRRMFRIELVKCLEDLKLPEGTDLAPVLEGLELVQRRIEGIPGPVVTSETDLTPALKALGRVEAQLVTITEAIPDSPDYDLMRAILADSLDALDIQGLFTAEKDKTAELLRAFGITHPKEVSASVEKTIRSFVSKAPDGTEKLIVDPKEETKEGPSDRLFKKRVDFKRFLP